MSYWLMWLKILQYSYYFRSISMKIIGIFNQLFLFRVTITSAVYISSFIYFVLYVFIYMLPYIFTPIMPGVTLYCLTCTSHLFNDLASFSCSHHLEHQKLLNSLKIFPLLLFCSFDCCFRRFFFSAVLLLFAKFVALMFSFDPMFPLSSSHFLFFSTIKLFLLFSLKLFLFSTLSLSTPLQIFLLQFPLNHSCSHF